MEGSKHVFRSLVTNRQFREILADLDIADEDQRGLFESLDVDGSGTLTLPEIVEGVKTLRGDPRRSDVISGNLRILHIQEELQCFEADAMEKLATAMEHLQCQEARLKQILTAMTLPRHSLAEAASRTSVDSANVSS